MTTGSRLDAVRPDAGKSKVVIVLPAYNAEKTLARTCAEIPEGAADELLLVDDASGDRTVDVARRLGIPTLVHPANRGYGANQKSCYRDALERGADIVVMLHPDYQYPPQLIPAMVALIRSGMYDVVLGSRILVRGALEGGMPLYKYVGNRVLTLFQNLVIGRKLSEYHTGFRAFRREVLETLPLDLNSDGFVFDNQILCQAIYHGFSIGEISSPCRYFPEASSIGPLSSLWYAGGVAGTAIQFRLNRWGLLRSRLFDRGEPRVANSRTPS
jgi:glycosyltransferase involved in cell wall biosynthesis